MASLPTLRASIDRAAADVGKREPVVDLDGTLQYILRTVGNVLQSMMDNDERPGNRAVHVLIVPADPAFARVQVGGLSVLLRAVCASARAAGGVTVLRTAACPDDVVAETAREVRRRELLAPVEWRDTPDDIPDGASLVLLTAAAVFEPATVAALVARARSQRQIVRCRRPGDTQIALWCAPAEQARELLDRLRACADVAQFDCPDARDADPGPALLERVSDDTSRRRAENEVLARSRKQSDSAVAKWFDRRISAALTRRILGTDTMPNQVTLANMLLGVAGAVMLLAPSHAARVVGGMLLVLTVIFDGCDGEIARVKFLESNAGRLLDFFTDNVVNATAILAAGLGYYLHGGSVFYYYASVTTFVLSVACVPPVYYLFFRRHKGAIQAEEAAEGFDPYRTAEGMSGRDFVYLIFFLSLVDRVHWFTPVCLVGLSVFFLLVSALALLRLLENAGFLPARETLALSPCGSPSVGTADDEHRPVVRDEARRPR